MAPQITLDSNLALNPGLLPGKLTNPLPLPPSFSSPHPESPGKYLLLLFSHSVVSNSLWPHGLQYARLCCPSLSPWVCSNSCPLSQWCHPTISSSVIPFSSCPQSFPESGSFPVSLLFTSGGWSIRFSALASVLPVNTQGWFLWGLTVWSPCWPRDSQESSPAPQFESINSSALSLLYGPALTSVRDYCKNNSFEYMQLCQQSDISAFQYTV